MITDKEIADKRNDVLMLRLQISEHKERRRLDEIEQKSLTDASALGEANETIHNAQTHIEALEAELRDEMQQKYVAIRLGAEKAATVLRLNETISDLRMAASDMLDTINECARGEAKEARALMKVIKAVDTWHRCMIPTSLSGCTNLIKVLDDVLEDYSSAPEIPVVTLKDFIRELGGSVADRDNRIEQLIVLNEALRTDVDGRDRHIEELMKDLAARNHVIKDFKAIETKETDRLHEIIEEKKLTLREYREENDEVWGKLERIGMLASYDSVSALRQELADMITKIIQDE